MAESCSVVARQSSARLKEIVTRMKAISNLDRAEARVVDLNELWRETVAFLHGELERKLTVKLDLKPLPPVRCRPQQMSAVFSQLLRNAAAATEDRGVVEVASAHHAEEVLLEVHDHGRAIARERLAHIFEPSFRVEGGHVTTSNWGLFVSRAIVNEHGGEIEIDSEEGHGTTARIHLPVDGPFRPSANDPGAPRRAALSLGRVGRP